MLPPSPGAALCFSGQQSADGWSAGQSFGASAGTSAALKVAKVLDLRVGSLILLEPNPFYLLEQNGRTQAFLESRSLRDHVEMAHRHVLFCT